MQMPLNVLDAHRASFQRQVLPALVGRDIGVIAMKTSASGNIVRQTPFGIDECLRFAWTLPIAVAVVGMERESMVRENARLARAHTPLSDGERAAMIARGSAAASRALEWYKS